MAEHYLAKVDVEYLQQSDGSWVAKSTRPPFLAVKRSRRELEQRVPEIVRELLTVLYEQRPAGQQPADFLRELGIPYEWERTADEGTTTIRVPVPA